MSFKSRELGKRTVDDSEFGHRDRLGRMIGCRIQMVKVEVTEGAGERDQSAERASWYPNEPGVYFWFHGGATRAGEYYGPSQPGRHFRTDAERAAYYIKYVERAAKAAAKRAGR